MKLPIKRKYFDEIKNGEKQFEFRDAHITFVAEDNGEQLTMDVWDVKIMAKTDLSPELQKESFFTDDRIIRFWVMKRGQE